MFEIISRYKNREFEVIDTASSLSKAIYLVNEYRMAFGDSFRVEFRKT